jgi:hypothetical protein
VRQPPLAVKPVDKALDLHKVPDPYHFASTVQLCSQPPYVGGRTVRKPCQIEGVLAGALKRTTGARPGRGSPSGLELSIILEYRWVPRMRLRRSFSGTLLWSMSRTFHISRRHALLDVPTGHRRAGGLGQPHLLTSLSLGSSHGVPCLDEHQLRPEALLVRESTLPERTITPACSPAQVPPGFPAERPGTARRLG